MKTTKADFEYFKSKCELWLEVLSLASWEVYYVHEKDDENMAGCFIHYAGRKATISLSTNWRSPVTKEELSRTALHECLELLMLPLQSQAQARVWDSIEYDREHHTVIRTIEKLLFRRGGA